MERTQQNKKRGWRFWQYRSLILYIFLCFFCIGGQAVEKEKLSKRKKQSLKAQLKIQKNIHSRKQFASKKNSGKRELASKTPVAKKASLKDINSKRTKQSITSDKSSGYKIPSVKAGSLFKKMRLKKGDIVQSIDGKSVHSKKHIYRALAQTEKKQKKFSLFITRNKKDFLISYQLVPFKTKRRIFISDIQKIKNKAKVTNKRELASSNNKQISQAKKTLVPKKYKSHLQRAFVVTLNSFIYEKPDFDAPQLYPLATGEKILISKKVFRPPHNFGSFYKIFLVRPKKIVGYVSEAEVVPEFLKNTGKYEANPAYKLAQKQMKEDKVLDIDLIDKVNKQRQTNKQMPSKNNKKSYVGLSVGFLAHSPFITPFEKNVIVGLKFSGYNLLLSSVNMDFNFAFTPYDFQFFHFDALAAYPLLGGHSYHLFILGGLKFDINRRMQDIARQNSPGVSGALSLLIPINQKFLFRVDAKTEYGFGDHSFLSIFLSSLQMAF